jgi:predicted glycosyltransferase
VVIYSGDNMGLGHLRRCTRIGSRLVRELPGTEVLVLSGLPLGCPFEIPAGVDVIKLPSARKIKTGVYGPRTLSMSHRRLIRLRTDLIRSVLDSVRPDLLLVDHLPTGVSGELLPLLPGLDSSTRVVLGLRDIVDDPEVTRRLWGEQGVFEALDAHFDEVLIYGCREVFDAARHYHLDREVRTRIRYCGYVCSDEVGEGVPSDVRTTSQGTPRRVVITAGGGEDGYPMMRSCLEALRLAAKHTELDPVFVTGPFMPRESRELLEAAVPGSVLWRVDALPDLLETADVILTMAGYNTLVEAIRLGKRPVVIPRPGPSAEQRMRARVFAERNLVHRIGPGPVSASSLAGLILDCCHRSAPRGILPGMDGLADAVASLGMLLDARRSGPRAATAGAAKTASRTTR